MSLGGVVVGGTAPTGLFVTSVVAERHVRHVFGPAIALLECRSQFAHWNADLEKYSGMHLYSKLGPKVLKKFLGPRYLKSISETLGTQEFLGPRYQKNIFETLES